MNAPPDFTADAVLLASVAAIVGALYFLFFV